MGLETAKESAGLLAWMPYIAAIVGSGVAGVFLKGLFDRHRTKAEAGKIGAEERDLIVGTAQEVVALVRDQMAELVRQNTELQKRVEELQREVKELRRQVEKAAEMEAEVTVLRSENVRLQAIVTACALCECNCECNDDEVIYIPDGA